MSKTDKAALSPNYKPVRTARNLRLTSKGLAYLVRSRSIGSTQRGSGDLTIVGSIVELLLKSMGVSIVAVVTPEGRVFLKIVSKRTKLKLSVGVCSDLQLNKCTLGKP